MTGAVSGRGMVAIAAVILLMAIGGGIPGLAATLAIGLLALALVALMPGALPAMQAQPAVFRVALLLVWLLPLLQLVPLPPSIWHTLPGAPLRVDTLALTGLADSWQPLSLVPVYTAGSAVIAIAFAALVVLLLALPADDARRVGWAIVAMVGANIVVGLVQVVSDGQLLGVPESDRGFFTGFYANKNHAALVLAASVPIMAFLLGSRRDARGARAALGLYAGVIAVALVTTNSRAGIILGVVALLLTAGLYVRSVPPVWLAAIAAVAVAGIVLVSTTQAFSVVFSRFGVVDQDLRWQYLATSRWLIDRFWLWGSGIGSFSTLYAVGEPLSVVKPSYVNQLHDEYPQLLIEAGVAGIAVLLLLAAGVAQRGVAVWRAGDARARLPLICGGIVLLLVALHSVVDYPLRRPAVLPVLAFALMLCIRGDLRAATGVAPRRAKIRA